MKRRTLTVLLLVSVLGAGATVAWQRSGSPPDTCQPSAATTPGSDTATPPAASTLPRFSHVVVIVMENKECSEVLGKSDAAYINGLARRYALAGRWYAIRHPSLPNYIAMIGGSTYGISDDCTACSVDGPNLVGQLETAGISWKAYMEGMPAQCFTGSSSGRYVKRHNPFVYFRGIASRPRWCAKVVALDQLGPDLDHGRLPAFSFITPDVCHDMHDCSVAVGDSFLARLVPRILRALSGTDILVLTWDEGATDAGCCGRPGGRRVATIVAGPGARAHAVVSARYSHYSLLATIERAWHLPLLGGAAAARDFRLLLRHP